MKQTNVSAPEINNDGSFSFTISDSHRVIKVHAEYTEGCGYKIKDYEVLKGENKDEKPRQIK